MTWLPEQPGTLTQWAVEHTYDNGEKRYFTDGYNKAEAYEAAEVYNLERLRDENPGGPYPVSSRAVSRTVTHSPWEPS